MKAVRIVAIALFGWYLMIPPPSPSSDEREAAAPMVEWKILERFDSDRRCEAVRAELIDRMPLLQPARCVRSDDLQLRQTKAG